MNNSGLGLNGLNIGQMLGNVGFIRGFVEQGRLSWTLFRDGRVPLPVKAIPVLTVLFLISPPEWVINLIPVLGQMEDLAILELGMTLFIRAAPQTVVNEHLAQIRSGYATIASRVR